MDPYRVLGVDGQAPHEVIAAAYRALAKKYHPDLNPGNTSVTAKMRQVNDAYALIGTPDNRRVYDAQRARQRATTTAPPPPPRPPQGGSQHTSANRQQTSTHSTYRAKSDRARMLRPPVEWTHPYPRKLNRFPRIGWAALPMALLVIIVIAAQTDTSNRGYPSGVPTTGGRTSKTSTSVASRPTKVPTRKATISSVNGCAGAAVYIAKRGDIESEFYETKAALNTGDLVSRDMAPLHASAESTAAMKLSTLSVPTEYAEAHSDLLAAHTIRGEAWHRFSQDWDVNWVNSELDRGNGKGSDSLDALVSANIVCGQI